MYLTVLIFEFLLLPFPRNLSGKIKQLIYGYIVKRKALFTHPTIKINGFSTVNSKTSLGENVNFNGLKITGSGIVNIGNHFHSGNNCQFITTFHNYTSSKIPYDSSNITKKIIIEQCVWLGDNVTILGGVTIGEGAIIQAGSVVVNSIPALAIAGGHPATVFKQRDAEHYYKLKAEKAFF